MESKMMSQNYCTMGYGMQTGNLHPIATLAETPTNYLFYFEIPGTKSEDVEVILQGQYLTIRGKQNSSIFKKEVELVQSERIFGQFQRTVAVPTPVDQDAVKAELEDGILEVTLKKKGENQTPFKKVPVNKVSAKGHSSKDN
jgi:HSP20 family protein